MAIRIIDVKQTPIYTWQDIRDLKDWNTVKNTNISWQSVTQTSKTGKRIKIEVEATEGTWESVKELLLSWQTLKDRFASWLKIKNW